MKTNILSSILVLSAAVAFAEPAVTVDKVQQRFPWNGIVDIDYTISGLEGDPLDYVVEFSLDGTPLSNFVAYAACDLPTANGANRAAWWAAQDGYTNAVKGATLSARLIRRVLTATDATYMIIDLTAGKDAAAYPVRYAADCASSQFNKDTYKSDRLVLKRLPKGDFWMGEGGYDGKGSRKAEWNSDVTYPGNRHRVRLSHDFYLGLFELTQGQYLNVIGTNPALFKNDRGDTDLRRPVENISYATMEDADGVLARLTARVTARTTKVGTFRLPTESQWEYACRAGTTTMRYYGDYATSMPLLEFNVVVGATAESYLNSEGGRTRRTSAVGRKLPNPWGFYDMFGNVQEFCSDWYGAYPEGTEEEPAVDPEKTETTDFLRCMRGQGYGSQSDHYTVLAGARGYSSGYGGDQGLRVSITLK